MSDSFSLFTLLSVPILLGAFFLFFGIRKKRRLNEKDVQFFLSKVGELSGRTPSERIMGYDKILDHILSRLGYGGTLGEKLKARPGILSDCLEEVWRFHKIRNRLAHELGSGHGENGREADQYESLVKNVLRKR